MPIYEYRCQDCGSLTERLEGIGGAERERICPSCGGGNLEKVLSAPSYLPAGHRIQSQRTCCGRTERCETPPCSTGGPCRRETG